MDLAYFDDADPGPRVRRVPPPPPPGFGDDEYYQLYGRPEDYHRHRQHLEDAYRQYREEHYYRPRVPVTERLQLQRPFGRRPPPVPQRRPHPKMRLGYREPRFGGRDAFAPDDELEAKIFDPNDVKDEEDYNNFKVTLRCESEGTPSLSGMDDTEEESDEEPSSRPRRVDLGRPAFGEESEDEDLSADGESPVSDFSSDEDDEEPDDVSEDDASGPPPGSALRSVVVEKPCRVPVKERLGVRLASPVRRANAKDRRHSSVAKPPSDSNRRRRSRDEEHTSRSSGKRQGRSSKTPTKNVKRSRDARRRSSKGAALSHRKMEETHKENEKMLRKLASKQKDRLKISNLEKNKSLAKLAGIELPPDALDRPTPPKNLKRQRRRGSPPPSSSTGSSVDRGHDRKRQVKRSPEKSTASNKNSARKSRHSSERRDKLRKRSRSKSPRLKKSDTRSKRSSSPTHRSSLQTARSRQKNDSSRANRNGGSHRRRSRDRIRVSGLESTTSTSKRERILLSRSRSRERRAKNLEKEAAKSPDRWQHDKFQSGLMPLQEDSEPAFGTHWTKNKTERSKERSRRSRSSSSSKYGDRRRRGRSSSSRSRRKRSRSYSSRSSSRSSSFSQSSASSGSVRRERRNYMAEKKKKMELAAAAGIPYVEEPLLPPSTIQPCPDTDGVNLALTGNLLKDTNVVNGVVVKYSEPQEARKPKTKWRLYVFKGIEELPILYIHRQSAYLLGRDRKVADIPIDHPSCSKQHAVLQYRLVDYTRADGSVGKRVIPYVVDLDSANGTTINNKKIEPRKYVQLFERDILKFGFSSREYVLLHDQSKDDEDLGVD